MICISVTPESRRLAKADLLNASRQGDLIELCLDHLVKSPDIADLLDAVDKPILITCRRSQDGGKWTGDEEDRLQLLRQAIVAEPEWIELDLDIAGKVPRYGKTRRVVAYTSLYSPLGATRTEIDEVTGLKYPVSENRYVFGVEMFAATLAVSGGLFGLSLAFRADEQSGTGTTTTSS